jgi:hypothetical protein
MEPSINGLAPRRGERALQQQKAGRAERDASGAERKKKKKRGQMSRWIYPPLDLLDRRCTFA